jgi:hypothetical protein
VTLMSTGKTKLLKKPGSWGKRKGPFKDFCCYIDRHCYVHRQHGWAASDRWTSVKQWNETKHKIQFYAIVTGHMCMTRSSRCHFKWEHQHRICNQ